MLRACHTQHQADMMTCSLDEFTAGPSVSMVLAPVDRDEVLVPNQWIQEANRKILLGSAPLGMQAKATYPSTEGYGDATHAVRYTPLKRRINSTTAIIFDESTHQWHRVYFGIWNQIWSAKSVFRAYFERAYIVHCCCSSQHRRDFSGPSVRAHLLLESNNNRCSLSIWLQYPRLRKEGTCTAVC